jgi:hypothetical protein
MFLNMAGKIKNYNGFIQIPLLIAIIAGLIIVGGAGYLGAKQYQNHQVIKEEKQQEPKNDNTQSDGPKETSGEGIYSITLESSPSRNAGEMSLSVRLKNLSATPFITNLGTDSCTLTDSKGRQYPAEFISESKLKKALLSGEETSIDIVRQQLRVSLIQKAETACDNPNGGPSDGMKCIYNNSGKCVCENLGVLKISDCIFRISTDGKQASNGWGKYPLTVTIEK